ncbi:MAG: hypothetical protein ABR564_04940 [Candidatus Dormibacteria bacterium]
MQSNDGIGWQSALVALGFLALVAAITVSAIARYPVDDALKIWTPLIALLGVVSGAFISYFFTRTALLRIALQARAAEARAETSAARVDQLEIALRHLAGRLDPDVWRALLEDPAIARAAEAS